MERSQFIKEELLECLKNENYLKIKQIKFYAIEITTKSNFFNPSVLSFNVISKIIKFANDHNINGYISSNKITLYI